MKMQVYLTADGMEQVLKGGVPYPYQITVRIEGCPVYRDPPENGLLLGDCYAVMPDRLQMLTIAEKKLKAELQEVQAEAFVRSQQLQERLNNLLALSYEPAAGQ